MVEIADEYISENTKMSKEEIKNRLENGTLPKHMMEIFQEAKNWWYHCGKQILIDNYHTRKAIIEDSV